MPTVTLTSSYKINSDLVMSSTELLDRFFFGIPIEYNGKRIADDTIEFFIRAAQKVVENRLNIKLSPQVISEDMDYSKNNWRAWGYVHSSFPVHSAIKVQGFFNKLPQISFPTSWISSRQSTDGIYYRQVHIIPSGSDSASINDQALVFNTLHPHAGLIGSSTIPNYWQITYCTGWDKQDIPYDILETMGKLASIGLFNQLGDLILGGAAIASKRIQLDGLSESVNTTMSAENSGYSARIRMYLSELKESWADLEAKYKGIVFEAL